MKLLASNGALGLLFLLQGFCALYFLVDIGGDVLGVEANVERAENEGFEFLFALVLLASFLLTGREIFRLNQRQDRIEDQLRVASGAFAEVIEAQFDEWALSESERAVAMMAIKGLSVAEMAAARNTREGTIKAQSAAVYRKAGVSGRLQLLSFFIEELVADAPAAREPA